MEFGEFRGFEGRIRSYSYLISYIEGFDVKDPAACAVSLRPPQLVVARGQLSRVDRLHVEAGLRELADTDVVYDSDVGRVVHLDEGSAFQAVVEGAAADYYDIIAGPGN